MNCKDLFALGVRLFGVLLITQGVYYVAGFIDGKLYPASNQVRDSAAANLIYASLYFAVAAFFLLWTHVIVGWTYGAEPKLDVNDDEPEARVESATPEA